MSPLDLFYPNLLFYIGVCHFGTERFSLQEHIMNMTKILSYLVLMEV